MMFLWAYYINALHTHDTHYKNASGAYCYIISNTNSNKKGSYDYAANQSQRAVFRRVNQTREQRRQLVFVFIS